MGAFTASAVLWKVLGLHLFAIFVMWSISVAKKDVSIVDRFWGLMFVYLSWAYFLHGEAPDWRRLLVLALVTLWGLRLSLHIHLRNRLQPEDIRYQRMRKKHGKPFWWQSFFMVFLLQGCLALVISMPLFWVFFLPSYASFTLFDIIGLFLWLVGFVFEAGSDWQLRRFKSRPANKGALLTTGFWSYTRHPNYFGDACIWWGFFFFALGAPHGWISVLGPLLMSIFLRYVSGVSLLEKDLRNSKPGYEEYMRRTPAFLPRLWPRWEGK